MLQTSYCIHTRTAHKEEEESQDNKLAKYRLPYTLSIGISEVSEATRSIRTARLSEPSVCLPCGSDNRGPSVYSLQQAVK